ncbi:hypothetical protein [Sarcina ventriculi]|uniref:hypothetical protein n=1 Tax=Sarcina ventriculi TaxID=1267 RepID=UPI00073E38FE|nr:hypothetical protein [Sarcina ventriculi]
MRSLYDDNIKKFNLWCRDNTSKVINIVFRPYDNLVILNDLIDNYLLKNKKILYIKKFFDVFKFKYNEGVEYITFDTLYSINKFYDLIILDDVSFYSEKRDIEIIEYISFLMKRCSKIILCSFEYILKKEASINLAGINNKKYFLEPRIIKSRLNFLNSMPKILYDYFQWFIKERRNVIIYTPNEIYTSSIFNYYIYVFGASKNINIIKDSGFILNNIINKEKINIIITHNSMSNIDNIKEFDLIFYFCDEKIFDSKKIIFSCAKLNSDKLVREVLLLCQKETYNVSQAKKIARSYNQIICQEEI